MSDKITLSVNDQKFEGWKSARVTRGIESIAGSFELKVADRWAGQDKPWPIREGDEVTVLVNDVPVITGHLDERSLSFDAASGQALITGRDKTADLVDSSALLDRWEFRQLDVLKLAQKICKPLNITVSLQPGLTLPQVKKLSVDPGETVGQVIDNLCRAAAVLPVSDGVGGLLLTRAGAERAPTELVEGINILTASARFSHADRFHRYIVLGQHKGSNDLSGENAAGIRGEATDPNVRSTRVLVIRPEGSLTAAQAQKRAQWEATVRAAKADSVSVTVAGWTAAGKLWPVNQLVRVRSSHLQVDGDMLITSATYLVSHDGGRTTQLELRRRTAFRPMPSVPAVEGDQFWPELRKGSLT